MSQFLFFTTITMSGFIFLPILFCVMIKILVEVVASQYLIDLFIQFKALVIVYVDVTFCSLQSILCKDFVFKFAAMSQLRFD